MNIILEYLEQHKDLTFLQMKICVQEMRNQLCERCDEPEAHCFFEKVISDLHNRHHEYKSYSISKDIDLMSTE